MADPDVSKQANSKEEESSDDNDRSFRRRIGICDPSSSSKLENNPVILKKNPMFFRRLYSLMTVIGRPRIMMDCLSLSTNLNIRVENGTSLRSRRKRSRWSCTLECTEISMDKRIQERWCRKVCRFPMVEFFPKRHQQSQIRALRNFSE